MLTDNDILSEITLIYQYHIEQIKIHSDLAEKYSIALNTLKGVPKWKQPYEELGKSLDSKKSICEHCGKEFVKRVGRQKFCSKFCSKTIINKARNEKRKIIHGHFEPIKEKVTEMISDPLTVKTDIKELLERCKKTPMLECTKTIRTEIYRDC